MLLYIKDLLNNRKGAVNMPMSKAQIKANAKYNKKAYDRIEIQVKKGTKELIENIAKSMGESTNAFIKKAIYDRIKADTGNDVEL